MAFLDIPRHYGRASRVMFVVPPLPLREAYTRTTARSLPYPTTSCTIPLRARSSKNPSMAYFLLLLNHIGVCSSNALIQYSEVVLELASSNEIYRNLTGSLVWRPERNGKEFDPLFAFCNCSSSVAVIVSPLVSFECSMTVKSSCNVDLIANS
jgi:hypothetical protein